MTGVKLPVDQVAYIVLSNRMQLKSIKIEGLTNIPQSCCASVSSLPGHLLSGNHLHDLLTPWACEAVQAIG